MVVLENRVFVARCDAYEEADLAVGRVLDAFGGASAILGGKKRVLVKPNLIMPKSPECAATTHPAIVAAVCAAFIEAGAEVSIIDSTGMPHRKTVLKRLYGKCRMTEAAEEGGAVLSYNLKSRTVPVPDGRMLRDVSLLASVLEADLVVSVAKAKTHGMMAMSGCVKNLFGCVPGTGKPMLHGRFPRRRDFAGMVVDVCQAVAPGFSLADGVWGMEGAGPTNGDPKHLRVVAGGPSPYAVDLALCHLMGLRLDTVHTIAEAAARNLAPGDPMQLGWMGDDPASLRQQFRPASKHKGDALPTVNENCTGCGDCARICPQKCINIVEKKAVIAANTGAGACIRCYCCHEFCPFGAVSI